MSEFNSNPLLHARKQIEVQFTWTVLFAPIPELPVLFSYCAVMQVQGTAELNRERGESFSLLEYKDSQS